jgi:hypothetical protein
MLNCKTEKLREKQKNMVLKNLIFSATDTTASGPNLKFVTAMVINDLQVPQ